MSLKQLRARAKQLVSKYGKTVTYTQIVTGDYDPTTGDSVNTATAVDVKAVIDGYSDLDRVGTQIQVDDLKMTIADLETAPTSADTITLDEQLYNVISVKRVYAAEAVAIYEVQARAS